MKYVMVAVWSVLVAIVVSYVLTSMANEPFNLSATFVLAAIFAVFVIVLGEVGLKKQNDN